MMPFHLEGWSGCWPITLVIFCYSIKSQFSSESPNPEHCLDPNPDLCLLVTRTQPCERGPMYFTSSVNRLYPYAYYKPFLLRLSLFIDQ